MTVNEDIRLVEAAVSQEKAPSDASEKHLGRVRQEAIERLVSSLWASTEFSTGDEARQIAREVLAALEAEVREDQHRRSLRAAHRAVVRSRDKRFADRHGFLRALLKQQSGPAYRDDRLKIRGRQEELSRAGAALTRIRDAALRGLPAEREKDREYVEALEEEVRLHRAGGTFRNLSGQLEFPKEYVLSGVSESQLGAAFDAVNAARAEREGSDNDD